MSIQIEEGKCFRTRAGRKFGPARRVDTEYLDESFYWASPDGQSVYPAGNATRASANPDNPHDADIIGEWTEPTDVKAALADEAKAIVSGARRSAYGTPEDNFERIARFWQVYFENTGRGDVKLTAADVSPMMRLMKEARLCETPDHRDSFVDLIGYTLTGAEINKVDPQKSS